MAKFFPRSPPPFLTRVARPHSSALLISRGLLVLRDLVPVPCEVDRQRMAVAMAFGSVGVGGRRLLLKCGCFARGFRSVAPRTSRGRSVRIPSLVSVKLIKAASAASVEDGSPKEKYTVPIPKVIIDQDSDPDATIVDVTFGDRLGALIDTMNALKNLGLNVVKANVFLDASGKHNRFAITNLSTGRKVEDPELLEAIRMTVINNLLKFHPESSTQLALGAAFGVDKPSEQVDVDIATHVTVYGDGPDRSLLVVEAADRPGLLVDLVKIITDISVSVESGEFDTEGLLAKAKFHVSYQGKAIIKPLQQALANSLRYFLRRPTTEEASF